MKKYIALLLALVLVMGLCACGGSGSKSGETVQDKLVNGEWKTAGGNHELSFVSDGTGSIRYPNGNTTDLEWTLDDGVVSITLKPVLPFGATGNFEHRFSVLESESGIRLEQTEDENWFSLGLIVPSSEYESATKERIEALSATAPELDWKSATAMRLSNAARFNQEYVGKFYRWTATVYNIGPGSCDMAEETRKGLPYNAITVTLSESELATLTEGKVVTVLGKLSDAYRMNGYLIQ